MSKHELERLSSARLRAYRNRLLSLEESISLSDMSKDEAEQLDRDYVYFKESEAWIELHALVTELLGNAEDIGR